jgi:hypothetical protein
VNNNLSRFYDYLRAQRASQLARIELYGLGNVRLSERRDGGPLVDITDQHVETLKRYAAEIEELLTEAGEPFE